MKVLVLLQNAWRRGADPGDTQFIPRLSAKSSHRVWVAALWRSQSGRRLREMLPEEYEVVVGNASPFIGGSSRSKFPIDTAHVARQLEREKPDLVLLLGEQAQKAGDMCTVPVVTGPHPAWRLLSKEHTAQIRRKIELRLEPA